MSRPGDRLERWLPLALATVALLAGVAALLASDGSMASAVRIAAAFGAAAIVALVLPSRPIVAFGIVFVLSSLTDLVIELPPGTMRMEQPALAIALAAVLAAWAGLSTRPSLPPLRPLVPFVVAGAVYLAALVASSALLAPQPLASLRFALWTGFSMVGGIVAYGLVARDPHAASRWIVATGGALAVSGIVLAGAYYLVGPFQSGIHEAGSIFPRVRSWAPEANLYASFLAAIVPLGLEGLRRQSGRLPWVALVVTLLVGMALGITRGAWAGLIGGCLVQGAVLLARREPARVIGRLGGLTAAGAILGIVVATVLLDARVHVVPGDPGTEPTQISAGTDWTVTFRLNRIPPALEDLRSSPLIGLGADSFGQRHGDPSRGGAPDHLAIMAVAVVYESGLIGFGALALLGLLVGRALWKASAADASRGLAAAYLGSLTVLLIAYQATNALHFAWDWLLLGSALGLLARPVGGSPRPGDQRSSAQR